MTKLSKKEYNKYLDEINYLMGKANLNEKETLRLTQLSNLINMHEDKSNDFDDFLERHKL